MNLKEIILNCNEYHDDDEYIKIVYAEKISNKFSVESNAKIVEIPTDEMDTLNINELTRKYCPEYEYFLELFILQDFYNDLNENEEYASESKKVNRVIYYAEYDA